MDVDREDVSNECHQVIAGVIAKGKRSKRRPLLSPFVGGIAASMCSSSAGGAGDQDDGDTIATATASIESTVISSTEEEEDMANCLILLAQGRGGKLQDAPATVTKSGLYVYECKTCNRIFPSFQALGGHRASHKKPKLQSPPLMVEPATPAFVVPDVDEEDGQLCKTAFLAPLAPLHFPKKALTTQSIISNIVRGGKQKVHECSICGLEFRSGQALGGHMRRHRTGPTAANQAAPTNPNPNAISEGGLYRNILPLDLNLPAPEDDCIIDSKFAFGSTQQQRIHFTGPVLVDCHY